MNGARTCTCMYIYMVSKSVGYWSVVSFGADFVSLKGFNHLKN